jgi:hypothetical protein
MEFKIIDNLVYKVITIETKSGQATVEEFYDSKFHIKLSTDKPTITANGTDAATITAKVYNYLDEPQTDWTGEIIFELDGEQQAIQTTNGEVSITVQSEDTGKLVIRTAIPNFRNGEVEVTAV